MVINASKWRLFLEHMMFGRRVKKATGNDKLWIQIEEREAKQLFASSTKNWMEMGPIFFKGNTC